MCRQVRSDTRLTKNTDNAHVLAVFVAVFTASKMFVVYTVATVACRIIIIIINITIKGICIAQVRKGHKCAMSAEMAVWLRNCLCLYSYLHN